MSSWIMLGVLVSGIGISGMSQAELGQLRLLAVSSDGAAVAFVSGAGAVHVFKSTLAPTTTVAGTVESISWSPEGRYLAIEAIEAGASTVYLLDTVGSAPKLSRVPGRLFAPRWAREDTLYLVPTYDDIPSERGLYTCVPSTLKLTRVLTAYSFTGDLSIVGGNLIARVMKQVRGRDNYALVRIRLSDMRVESLLEQ
jgi:hypothetical protein